MSYLVNVEIYLKNLKVQRQRLEILNYHQAMNGLMFSQLSLSLQLSHKARIIRIHRGNYRYFSHSIRKYYIVFAHVVSYQKGNPAY